MKIVENLAILNADKVWLGDKDIVLTLDTDTAQVTIDAPAMFQDPVVSLDLLEAKLELLKTHIER